MRLRPFGKTGLKVSEIGFGCWAIGGNAYGNVCDKDSRAALETAWQSGINFYDTADIYGEGHSETLVGEFLKEKPRREVLVASKVGWDFYPPTTLTGRAGDRQLSPVSSATLNSVGHKKNFDPAYIRFACEQSLKRLGLKSMDLYQLHNPSLELIRQKDILNVLADLKKEKKVRFIGVSVHTEAEALAALEDERVDAIQVIFNLLDQRMAAKVFPAAERRKVAVIVREPLASGLLTGKYKPEHEFPKNDHRRRWTAGKREADWEKIQCIKAALKGSDISLLQASLEYALSFSAVSTVIPGTKTAEQAHENIQASLHPKLTVGDIEQLRKAYIENDIFRKELNPK